MTTSTWWILLALVAVAVLVDRQRQARRHRADDYEAVRRRMPVELRTANLVWSEPKPLYTKWPLWITGSPDQVFRTEDGRLVVMEAKRRPQPIEPIKAQMTTYAWLLRHATSSVKGTPVARYGWVRFGDVHDATYIKVELFTDEEFTALVHEIEASNDGSTMPTSTDRKIYCERVCPHFRATCDGAGT